ncbi:unnamed protein product [Choristocarpus tenellus]
MLILLITALCLVCMMRHLRRQLNEFNTICRVAIFLVGGLVTFAFVLVVFDDEQALQRRLVVVVGGVLNGLLFWTPSYQAVWGYFTKDEAFLEMYTHGFFMLPTPAQLRASLADKLTIEELRVEFLRYTRARAADELVEFYSDVLDRDTVEDYFERQAVTMRMIDLYIKPGAVCEQVNISGNCRNRILNSEVTRLDIFEESRIEVLRLLEVLVLLHR